MAPVAVRGGALCALVFLDRELAPERGIGDAALPHEHEFALAATAAVGSEQAMGAVGDGGLHRSSADARDEMIARETNGFGHRRPPDLVAGRTHHPVGSEGTGGGLQVVHGRMGLERTCAGPIDDRAGRRRIRCPDLSADHRFVERVPARLPQPIVDGNSRVRFGMTSGHPVFLWRDGVVRRVCTAISEPARRKADCSPSLGRKDGLAGWKRSVVLTGRRRARSESNSMHVKSASSGKRGTGRSDSWRDRYSLRVPDERDADATVLWVAERPRHTRHDLRHRPGVRYRRCSLRRGHRLSEDRL